MVAKPWLVSVLSTAYDLKEYREDIIKLLKDKGFQVSAYEEPNFPVEVNVHSHDSCLIALERADIAIVIIDKRSGGIYYNTEDKDIKITITEAEYLNAVKQGIPIFFFVRREAFDELHAYKEGYKTFCKNKGYKSTNCTKMKKYRDEYNKCYRCTYVEEIHTLLFIDNIQKAYKKLEISNWMSFYTNRKDFLDAVEGRLAGYTRMLLQRLAKSQRNTLLDNHTSTALGMSLGDVLESKYYIEPPHEIESGKSNINVYSNMLSDEIKTVMKTNSSLLIYGEAGYGKTTILAKCFADHVEQLEKVTSYNIPLFLPLKNKGSNYHFDLKKYIEEELANVKDAKMCHTQYPYLDLSHIKIHFYCDGFDEIAETLSSTDLDRIKDSDIFSYPLVLTCRKQYTSRYLNEFNFVDKFSVRIQMKKWDMHIARNYIANFCNLKGISEGEKNNILAAVDGNNDLQQVLDSPLLISMFLWFIENNHLEIENWNISRAKLFENWIVSLSKRELSKHNATWASAELIIKIWEFSAWQVYWCRMRGEKLHMDDLIVMLTKQFSDIRSRDISSWFDALFDCTAGHVNGTFHEQFMEYLVARYLIYACENRTMPYPEFLKSVLRPEINRYFREIWREKSKEKQNQIYEAIKFQYFDNVGKEEKETIAIRVHAIYHLCRLDSPARDECIKRAFSVENQIPVMLSLYFGAIKLGMIDKEEEFYECLLTIPEYSKVNRGYHLAYYADSMCETVPPYEDDNQCDWKGTLSAFERHFGSNELGHYFLRRIDIITMIQLIEARKNIFPLTEEKIIFFEEKINDSLYGKKAKYASYNKKVISEYDKLKTLFYDYFRKDE